MELHNLVKMMPEGNLYVSVKHQNHFSHQSTAKDIKAHIHDFFEVYFNISGDVSLVVEGNKYAVSPGDIIITKPSELHYIIINSDTYHEAYCLWFSGDGEYADILSPLKKRKNGENNKIALDKKAAEKMKSLLALIDTFSGSQEKTFESASATLDILSLLERHKGDAASSKILPERLGNITCFIEKNLPTVSVGMICEEFFISRSSVCRLFKNHLGTTPTRFIEDKRLAKSKLLLSEGCSVQETFEKCGFSDYSHFISLFKKRFILTPLKYKKISEKR